MTDPITIGARAVAQRLIPQHGPGVVLDVETALHARSTLRSEQYLDPVSLGSFIVSVATLAWTVYSDLLKKKADPAPEIVTRAVNVEFRNRREMDPDASDQLVNIVVTETIKAAKDQN